MLDIKNDFALNWTDIKSIQQEYQHYRGAQTVETEYQLLNE